MIYMASSNAVMSNRWGIGMTCALELTTVKTIIRQLTMGDIRILKMHRWGLAQNRLRTTVLKSEMCIRDKDVDYSLLSNKKIL